MSDLPAFNKPQRNLPFIVAVDFDGTIVRHRFPFIGEEVPGAIDTLKSISAAGVYTILWTCRAGERLTDAVAWCEEHGLRFDAVNADHPAVIAAFDGQGASPKVTADIYIDDRAFGGFAYGVDHFPETIWKEVRAEVLRRFGEYNERHQLG